MPLINVPWSKLKTLGLPRIGRAILFVPIFGYLILFNENIARSLNLIPLFGVEHLELGVSLRLLILYYGSCAISAAVAIYHLFCPTVVKRYENSSAFVQDDGPGFKDIALKKIEENLSASGYRAKIQNIRARYEADSSAGPKLTPSDGQKVEINNGILHLYYESLENSSPVSRILARLLYLFGSLCILIPAAQVFWKVSVVLVAVANSQFWTFIGWCCQ